LALAIRYDSIATRKIEPAMTITMAKRPIATIISTNVNAFLLMRPPHLTRPV
jgi:hypothetical protein